MKKLTKQEAIKNHRKMWNWIADETQRQQRIVDQWDYLEAFDVKDVPETACYCCEYAIQRINVLLSGTLCDYCPINWGEGESFCLNLYNEQGEFVDNGLIHQWRFATDWRKAAELARKIANLPENEGRRLK